MTNFVFCSHCGVNCGDEFEPCFCSPNNLVCDDCKLTCLALTSPARKLVSVNIGENTVVSDDLEAST